METRNLKDVLHLYLGCKLLVLETKAIVTFDEIHAGDWPVWTKDKIYCSEKRAVGLGFAWEEVKPILRPLPDMTEREMKELATMKGWGKTEQNKHSWEVVAKFQQSMLDDNLGVPVEQFRWLLSKHFDLFGFIEAGTAIDKTKL